MMHSRKKFEVIAEDYNSPFFRNYLFVKGTADYKRIFGLNGPTMAIFSVKNKIQYLTQMDTWVKAHDDFKQRALKDASYVEKLIDLADKHGQKMNHWTEASIYKADLTKLSEKKLIKLWQQFNELDSKEYTYGVALPILDFQGFSLVENAIKNFLQDKVPAKKYQHYFSVFTEPQANSFSQEQEESLLKIITKYFGQADWRKDIQRCKLEEIKLKYPKFYSDLKKHTENFAWVYFVYQGPAFTEAGFLNFIKDFLETGAHPEKRLAELAGKRKNVALLKKQYLKELKPDAFNAAMLKLAGRLVWAKPRRKDYQSKSYFHMEKLQREIGKRLFLSLEQARSLPLKRVEKFLASGKASPEIPRDFFGCHVCVRNGDNSVKMLAGKAAQAFAKKHFAKATTQNPERAKNATEFSGQIAFPGKTSGIVKIINRVEEMHKMEKGNILVSIATTPSIVPVMKKAAAILTDEGGLTCHASIVSREMEIPCIVGLKNISQILKDGDRVEVDANRGMVKKL